MLKHSEPLPSVYNTGPESAVLTLSILCQEGVVTTEVRASLKSFQSGEDIK